MTKEQLKKYRTLKAELADLELDIKSKTLHDSVRKSKKDFPWTLGNDHIEGVPDEDYDLLARKSDLKAQIREIEKFVNGIEDSTTKYIFEMKFLRNHTNQYIATKINKRDEGTVRKIITKYLKNSENSDFDML